jgi:hypothetical protein
MMKNFLMGTALTLSVSLLTVAAASAGDDTKPKGVEPTLKITGGATGTYHWYRNGHPGRSGNFDEKGYDSLIAMEDSSLNFQATGRMDSGWTDQMFYDWLLGFTGDVAGEKSVETNRIRVKGRYGTFIIGNYQGVENFMARGAYGVMGGTGGFDGNYKTTISRPTGLLLTTDLVGATKYSSKLSAITPRINGFQFGVTFTPNSEASGDGSNGAPHNHSSKKSLQEPFDITSWAFGVNYIKSINKDFSVGLTATGIVGHTKPPAGHKLNSSNLFTAYQSADRHRTKSYALGAIATYQVFDFGVEWINNGKSQQVKNPRSVLAKGAASGANPYTGKIAGFNAGKAFSIAGAYTFGLNKLSYGYYHSTRKFNGTDAKSNVHALAYDRAVAPGFSVFAEGVVYDFKSSASAAVFQNSMNTNSAGKASFGLNKNDGRTVLLGATTKF